MQSLVGVINLIGGCGPGMMRQHVPALRTHAIDIGRYDRRNALTAADFDVLVHDEYDEIGLFVTLNRFDGKVHIHAAGKNLAPAVGHRVAPVQRRCHGVDAEDIVAAVPYAHHRIEIVLFKGLVKRKLGFFWS